MANVTLLPESQRLDRYQLIGEIASGGMASVFLARLGGVGGFQRMVAIKRLHPHLAKEQEFVEMFLDEARLAASIHHKNVVPILEIGTSDSGYYLVMEYIEGVTLARLMTQSAALRDPVPRPVLLRIIIDALSGLHAAHELTDDTNQPMGVVHRDCSPQNILIGLDGCTRITDFGIARATSRLHNTREGAMKGKLAYMAPEQTQGEDFDRRADLWSVAVVLWEVLAQRRLFKSKTEAQTLKRLLHDPIPRLTEMVPTISPALASVCQMALEREPADRFQTAAEMADALESAAKAAARAEEPVATERTVEALMKARYAGDVTAQREEMRTFLQATPTMVGPKKKSPTDPGWMMPTKSEVGRLITDSSTWEKASTLEPTTATGPKSGRRVVESDVEKNGPTTSRSWPAVQTGPPAPPHPPLHPPAQHPAPPHPPLHPPAQHPPAQHTPAQLEDQTHIYDPTSTTGVTADPANHEAAQLPPPMQQSRELLLTRQRRRTWPWAVLFLFGVAGVGVFLFRYAGIGAGPTVVVEGDPEPSQRALPRPAASLAEPTPAASEDGPERAPSATASAVASPTPTPRWRPRPGTPRPTPAPVAPAPAPPPEPPAPAPAPAPKPKDLDDLSNPYR